MKKTAMILTMCLVFWAALMTRPFQAMARDFGLGVHILNPDELNQVIPYRGSAEKFYVTVPFHLSTRDTKKWNDFFQTAHANNITPILRLSTDFSTEHSYWEIPRRKEIMEGVAFLSTLQWSGERLVVLYNEPNHAAEWGGKVDPGDYADLALFTALWLKTEPVHYVVLPAGLDAAAPNSKVTMDSFAFWDKAFEHQPDLKLVLDGWASHSYPNPGFVGSPYAHGKQTMRGFESELAFLKKYGLESLPVYITETGWRQTRSISPLLTSYYRYAYEKIWNHSQVRGVTVFLFQGAPGPFSEFSLLTSSGGATKQLDAFGVVNKILGEETE